MLKNWKERISIRKIHIWLILIIIVTSVTVIVASFRLTNTFLRFIEAAEEHTELEKAAHELMDASDYLTESVQRFTIDGDPRFLVQYFTEAFESNRREEAVSKMSADEKTRAAMEQLKEAMNNSMALMEQEYYAMRLVIEAKDITGYPEVLNGVQLSEEDEVLSSEDKIRRATEIVLSDDYYEQKERIRLDMRQSLAEVDKLLNETKTEELSALEKELGFVRAVIIIQALLVLLMLRLTSLFGVEPAIRAVDRIKEDQPIPEDGARELRYLAMAYNRMYKKNKTSIEELNYKASHDELTGAYNRAGYDYLLSTIDLGSTYMLLVDIDDFKAINDTYGHETGDQVLMKLVDVLKSVFRDDDCICRIGGDEFIVFMVHTSGIHRRLIESKLEQISDELAKEDDVVPAFSISVGIVNGKDVDDPETMFERTDAAMYEAKKQGKNTYTFYTKK